MGKMFWIVFDGDGSDQRIQHNSALNATAEFSKEFSHPVGLSLWAMYQGIVVIPWYIAHRLRPTGCENSLENSAVAFRAELCWILWSEPSPSKTIQNILPM